MSVTSSPLSSRDKYLRKNYNITVTEYQILYDAANGCWACGAQPKEGKNLHVDHNHKTKNVRAILCWACNQIGRARGPAITPERLRGLAHVLESGEEEVEALIGHNGKGK